MIDRNQMVESNLGLVHSCANRFRNRGVEYDDLFQAGCVGLLKALMSLSALFFLHMLYPLYWVR